LEVRIQQKQAALAQTVNFTSEEELMEELKYNKSPRA
jgi:predicted RNA binding protein with dsRBD fold (UPF0201 family)